MNPQQEKALDQLTGLSESEAAEVVARWFNETGYNPDIVQELADAIAEEDEEVNEPK